MQTNTINFTILDLFSGAGGMSYGMHKNSHFKTAVALDMSAEAANTFKMNMPETEVLIGDITQPDIKEEIIRLSKEKSVNMVIGGPRVRGSV